MLSNRPTAAHRNCRLTVSVTCPPSPPHCGTLLEIPTLARTVSHLPFLTPFPLCSFLLASLFSLSLRTILSLSRLPAPAFVLLSPFISAVAPSSFLAAHPRQPRRLRHPFRSLISLGFWPRLSSLLALAVITAYCACCISPIPPHPFFSSSFLFPHLFLLRILFSPKAAPNSYCFLLLLSFPFLCLLLPFFSSFWSPLFFFCRLHLLPSTFHLGPFRHRRLASDRDLPLPVCLLSTSAASHRCCLLVSLSDSNTLTDTATASLVSLHCTPCDPPALQLCLRRCTFDDFHAVSAFSPYSLPAPSLSFPHCLSFRASSRPVPPRVSQILANPPIELSSLRRSCPFFVPLDILTFSTS